MMLCEVLCVCLDEILESSVCYCTPDYNLIIVTVDTNRTAIAGWLLYRSVVFEGGYVFTSVCLSVCLSVG